MEDELDSDANQSGEDESNTHDFDIIEIDSNLSTPLGSGTTQKTPKSKGAATIKRQAGLPRPVARGAGLPQKSGSTILRTRGVADFTKIGGQEVRLKDLYGQRNEDLKPILATRDHWHPQLTLPLHDPGSLRRSFFEKPGSRKKEAENIRKWYVNTGKEIFSRVQKTAILSSAEGQLYLNIAGTESINVLMGQISSPELITLEKLSCMNVAKPFQGDPDRRGWLLNLGAHVQDAQWAITEGRTQYLAVAVEQNNAVGQQPKYLEKPKAPAFSATASFPASIQIWAFESGKYGELDSTKEPHLDVVICADWGVPKQLRWCPVDVTDETNTKDANKVHIGILAGIWSDGRLRVIDVSYAKVGDSSTPHYMHLTQAAFDVSFPQTVPSCLHWLSGSTIAVGTAAGALAVWTLSRSETFSSSTTRPFSPKPWFYQQLADTYILTLSSGWPSQPQFISITTADGFARLYDLRAPNADRTASIRSRNLCLAQAWHEQTQTFIMPDEHYTLKHNPIRRFSHNLYSMRADSSIMRVAASPIHPCILIGGADGRVEAGNPIGRITNYKTIPWQQTWFMHEWRGPVGTLVAKLPSDDVEMSEGGPVGERNTSAISDAGNVSRSMLDQPLVRITEGYKAYQPGIAYSANTKKTVNPEVGKGITVYETKSAISSLAWNPNLKAGTWAAAGMASGLLRVEDIGV